MQATNKDIKGRGTMTIEIGMDGKGQWRKMWPAMGNRDF